VIDKKGRIFGKVSFVDLFAVAVLVAVTMVVYFNFGGGGRPEVGREQPIIITFFHPALEDFTVNALEIGVPVIRDGDDTFLGHVIGFDIGESISFMPNVQGFEVASSVEGYSSVSIHSRVYGRLSGGAAVLGGNVFGHGTELIIWAGQAKTILHISEIRPEHP